MSEQCEQTSEPEGTPVLTPGFLVILNHSGMEKNYLLKNVRDIKRQERSRNKSKSDDVASFAVP